MGRVRGFARGFLVTVEQLRQLERVTFECNYCERGHHCQYHEGWLDALDLARVPELLDIAEAAQAVEAGDVEALLRIGGSVEHRGYTHRTPDDFELTGDYQEDARYILPARDKLIEQALRAALSLLVTDEGEDDAKDRGRDPASDQ